MAYIHELPGGNGQAVCRFRLQGALLFGIFIVQQTQNGCFISFNGDDIFVTAEDGMIKAKPGLMPLRDL